MHSYLANPSPLDTSVPAIKRVNGAGVTPAGGPYGVFSAEAYLVLTPEPVLVDCGGPPTVVQMLNNLAALYSNQGHYSEAEMLYKQALEIWKKALGPDHPDVAQSLNNLAALYYHQGYYSEAEPLLKQALEIMKNVLGPDHPDVVTISNNLTYLFREQREKTGIRGIKKRLLNKTKGKLQI